MMLCFAIDATSKLEMKNVMKRWGAWYYDKCGNC